MNTWSLSPMVKQTFSKDRVIPMLGVSEKNCLAHNIYSFLAQLLTKHSTSI